MNESNMRSKLFKCVNNTIVDCNTGSSHASTRTFLAVRVFDYIVFVTHLIVIKY